MGSSATALIWRGRNARLYIRLRENAYCNIITLHSSAQNCRFKHIIPHIVVDRRHLAATMDHRATTLHCIADFCLIPSPHLPPPQLRSSGRLRLRNKICRRSAKSGFLLRTQISHARLRHHNRHLPKARRRLIVEGPWDEGIFTCVDARADDASYGGYWKES